MASPRVDFAAIHDGDVYSGLLRPWCVAAPEGLKAPSVFRVRRCFHKPEKYIRIKR